MMIDFNKPYITGKEASYIQDAIKTGKISGNGKYTQLAQAFFENHFSCKKTLLTASCTDALEMAAILCSVSKGDEVIVPSFTFVSSALAFVREGARIVFADSYPDNPNIDPSLLEQLISPKTKVIVVVHYAGVACDMDAIMEIAQRYGISVVEDAAQAIDSKYKNTFLGTIGRFGAFSFHETKNIQCGEGGLLAINNTVDSKRAEIIWEKGTNRAEFFRGEVNKYGWADTGSSFLPSELTSAFLYAQLESYSIIQSKRISLWNRYAANLQPFEQKGFFKLPVIPEYATCNGHMFYIILNSFEERSRLISFLKSKGIHAVFHYLSLHKSQFYSDKHDGRALPNSDYFEHHLLRLPLFADLNEQQVDYISEQIATFFNT